MIATQHLGALVHHELAVRQHVARSATASAIWMCCSTSNTEHPLCLAYSETTGSRPSTMIGARPSDISSSNSSRGLRPEPARGRASAVDPRQQPDASIGQTRRAREVRVGDVGIEPFGAVAEAEVLGDGEAEEDPRALGHVGDAELGTGVGERRASRCRRNGSRPASGRTIPEIARNVVVLPAPLGPSSATTSPSPTSRSRSRTTVEPL